jgi:hypothetical protein
MAIVDIEAMDILTMAAMAAMEAMEAMEAMAIRTMVGMEAIIRMSTVGAICVFIK